MQKILTNILLHNKQGPPGIFADPDESLAINLHNIQICESSRPKICCYSENLAVNYFTFTAPHYADKFENKQQILRRIKCGGVS